MQKPRVIPSLLPRLFLTTATVLIAVLKTPMLLPLLGRARSWDQANVSTRAVVASVAVAAASRAAAGESVAESARTAKQLAACHRARPLAWEHPAASEGVAA